MWVKPFDCGSVCLATLWCGLLGIAGVLSASEELPPWEEVREASGDPPAFQEICFDEFDSAQSLAHSGEVKAWFAAVPGERFDVRETRTELGACAEFEGLARLKMPWRENIAWRLSLSRFTRFRIHTFHGLEGVTLTFYEEELDTWAAYRTTRKPGACRPETYSLAATDEGRAWRTSMRRGGTCELRWQAGELLLTRGDVMLLRAPCPQMPDEIFCEGKAAVHGLHAVRSLPPPGSAAGLPKTAGAAPAEQKPPLAGPAPGADEKPPADPPTSRAADLAWTPKLGKGTQFTKLPDGSVELAAEKTDAAGWVFTPVPATGLQMTVLEIAEATPGTGVYLSRAEGAPSEVLRFVRDRKSGRLCLAAREDNSFEFDFQPIQEHSQAAAAPRQWIRLLYGCGALRWWISVDGIHWAVPEPSWGSRPGNVTGLGLHHVPGKDGCRIRLAQVRHVELTALNALAPAAVRQRAPALTDAPSIAMWVARATQCQPPDVQLDPWRRACALRTLAAGCGRELANGLLGLLLDEATAEGNSLEQQLALLQELAYLLDVRDDGPGVTNYLQRYLQLGVRALKQRGERPFSFARSGMMGAALPMSQWQLLTADVAIRQELLYLADGQRWRELRDFCRQVRFFRLQDTVPLLAWAEASAARHVSGRAFRGAVLGLQDDWRQPLVEEISRETYNSLAELRVALDGSSPDDVARQIVGLEPSGIQGLAPSLEDRELFVSLPTVIQITLETHPELKARIHEKYGRAALLRVQQAIREGNATAVQLATVQYAGTEAAAEAHRWLGDRALSGGWFASALAQYRQAATSANAATLRELGPAVRLAGALVGRPIGRALGPEVSFAGTTLKAPEFEALLKEILGRTPAEVAAAAAPDNRLAAAPPPPSGFTLQSRGVWDGPVGKEPATEVVPYLKQFKVDWAGRQVGTVVENQVLYANNRFQVAAFDLRSGLRLWQAQLPPEALLRAQDWGLTRMRPLLTSRRVLTRLLYRPGPTLVSLDKRTGEMQWAIDAGQNRHFVSDPVLVQGQLFVLILAQLEGDENRLQLGVLDAESGRILQQRDLLRLNDVWMRRRYCEVTPLDDGFVIALGGVLCGCDLSGNVRWLRKPTLLPPGEEPQWVLQDYDRPLLAGDYLYVVQPGVGHVECVVANTGRRVWSVFAPRVQRLLGLAGPRVIVQLEDGLLALDPETGKELWQHSASEILPAAFCGENGILYTTRLPLEEGKPVLCPQVVWLAPATGRATGLTRLPSLADSDPTLGPCASAGDRLWMGVGRAATPGIREWFELKPQGEASPPEPDLRQADLWLRHMPPRLLYAVVKKIGGWRLLSGETVTPAVVEPERWGRRDVPGIRCRGGLPIVLMRKVSVPPEGDTKLRLIVGNELPQEWQLQVRLGNQSVFSKDVTAAADPQPWKTLEINLAPHAGKSGWLTVEVQFLRGGDHADLYWESLEIVTR